MELTCDDCSIDSVGFSLASDSTSEQSPCYSDVNEMLNDLLKTAEEPQLTNAVVSADEIARFCNLSSISAAVIVLFMFQNALCLFSGGVDKLGF